MWNLREVALEDKYTLERGQVYLTGIQALVRVAIMQSSSDRQVGSQYGRIYQWLSGFATRGIRSAARTGSEFASGTKYSIFAGS